MKTDLTQLPQKEIVLFVEHMGLRTYRARQVIHWIYKKLARTFDEMTDLPLDVREKLTTRAGITVLPVREKRESRDGTVKFLFALDDGESIESVLIPNNRGPQSFTQCISSQAGCAAGCTFCITGRLGLRRNLRAAEITGQVMAARRHIEHDTSLAGISITNIVFMGMGEPLNNFREVRTALVILTELMGFSKRKITLSTSGIVPGIKKLGDSGPGVNLAVSLNATTDPVRSKIMPVNRKYPLKSLLKACREFPLPPNRRITFEYVLLGGLNDSVEDAHRLSALLKGLPSKVNLIPYNRTSNISDLKGPSEKTLLEFQEILRKSGTTAIVRKSMGSDISAACGQLKASYDKNG